MAGETWEWLSWVVWLRVSDEVEVKLSEVEAVIWRRVWGWSTCCQNGSPAWLLAGGLSSVPYEPLHRAADGSCLPRSKHYRRKRGGRWIAFYNLSSLVTHCLSHFILISFHLLKRGMSKILWTYLKTTSAVRREWMKVAVLLGEKKLNVANEETTNYF